jgi:cytochrome c-type biogenesis protein CcmH/NrfG
MRRNWIIALLLAAATLALYWPVRSFDMIYFDDPLLLTECPEAQAGLTWASVKWAFTSVVIANWQPVTNLSFLAVSQFFGIAPGAHHLANAVIHAANAALLFLLLWRLTNSTWRSAAAAAIFAWHPLRVESVAWIAERKDVLCAFFFLLTLLAWTKRNECCVLREKTSPSRITQRALFFWLALIFFALALMSKPMAVTLPFVVLLLDVWPLKRMASGKWRVTEWKPLVLEKIPFFALMILFCAVTYWVQHDYAAMTPWDKLGLAPRAANAISSYLAYPAQLFWPLNLAAIYPFPKSYDVTQTVLKAALLLAISIGCVTQLTRRPWLAVGWFWYLGTALPIIGLVQVGEQAMADRYTYLPLIGPVVALVWTAAEMFSRPRREKIIQAAAVLIVSTLVVLSARQLQFWRNTIALFEHNVAVTPANASAYFTLGLGYEHAGDTNRALVCYRTARMIEPREFQNRRSLAGLLAKQGQFAAAEEEYDSLLADEPTEHLDHLALAGLLAAQGRTDESLAQLNETLRLNPDCIEALNNLAWAFATSPRAEIRDGPRAIQLAQHACELTHFEKTIFLGTLAAAYAEAGKFDDAITTAQKTCDLAAKNGETNLLQKNQELLERYRQHQPARE